MPDIFELALVYKEDDDYKIEKVDSIKIGKFYQLTAIPAFANGVAFNDIVSVEIEDGQLLVDEVITPSGNSVLHVLINNIEDSSFIFVALVSFGVNINYLNNNTYLVIDVPKDVNYKNLREFLSNQKEKANIDVSEACISDHHWQQL